MFNEIDLEQIATDGEAPAAEPERQYYYMAQLKKVVSAQEALLGRQLRVYNLVVGCQMNAKDSEKLLGILLEVGYVETDSEETADFVIYNTCTVRENANQKVYGRLGHLNSLKRKNPALLIALCGCMMQEPQVVETIRKSYRFVDIVFGTHNIYKLAELLYRRMDTGKQVIDVMKDSKQIVEHLPAARKYPFKSGVNIMYGCDNFCTYCIVPYVRGRERSREPQEILDEVRQLAADGVVEIMLLGQNVNSYGKNLAEPVTFARLLQMCEEIPGIERIRFMTSHPKDLSDELIEVMANSKKICPHLHLPLQSGSTELLKKMNRHYTKESYLALAKKVREKVPGISITTDIIVGFPGETDEDFEDTLDVVRQVRYESAFTFEYSKRTGTPAAIMKDQVPTEVVKERFARLLTLVQTIAAEECGRDAGTVQTVLVEGIDDHEEGWLTGRLGNNIMVHFEGPQELIGRIVPVHLDQAKGFYYLGRLACGEKNPEG